jgi:hypothetical protein
MGGYLTLITEDTLKNGFKDDLRKFAIECGMKIYVLLEKGCSLPYYMLEADIARVEEFDGPVGSNSYRNARDRILDSYGSEHEDESRFHVELPEDKIPETGCGPDKAKQGNTLR